MSTENTKATIVLVHGAFHPPHYYRRWIASLRGRGHPVLAPPMATTGLDDSINGTTYIDDVAAIHRVLLPRLDAGEEAVLVCHSQGGIAGSAATEGHTVAERRARGLKGGIRAVVYVAAFALAERGVTLRSSLTSVNPAPLSSVEGAHLIAIPSSGAGFYSQLDEAEQAAYTAGLSHQSAASGVAPIHYVALDVQCPKTYIVCLEDAILPAEFQRSLAVASECSVVEAASDHSPFLQDDLAEQVVRVIIKVAEGE